MTVVKIFNQTLTTVVAAEPRYATSHCDIHFELKESFANTRWLRDFSAAQELAVEVFVATSRVTLRIAELAGSSYVACSLLL
jgi:hypothetical protein